MELKPGTVIDNKLRIVQIVGSGGYANVYKAEHLLFNKTVGLKVLQQNVGDSQVISRFQQEARICTTLSSQNIVKVYLFGVLDDGRPYCAMEYVEGQTLEQLLLARGPLSWEEAFTYTVEILKGLQHAHDLGVIHRDIKPSNLLVTHTIPATVKIADFGLAKVLHYDQSLTQPGNVHGTPLYMSPEQLCGDPVDARSDIYGLGCVLFELVTGNPPFEAEDYVALAHMHFSELPALQRCDVPAPVMAVIGRAIAKKPEARYQTAAEFRVAVHDVLMTRSSLLRRTILLASGASDSKSFGKLKLVVLTVLTLGALLSGIWLSYRFKVVSEFSNEAAAADRANDFLRADGLVLQAIRQSLPWMEQPAEVAETICERRMKNSEYKAAEVLLEQVVDEYHNRSISPRRMIDAYVLLGKTRYRLKKFVESGETFVTARSIAGQKLPKNKELYGRITVLLSSAYNDGGAFGATIGYAVPVVKDQAITESMNPEDLSTLLVNVSAALGKLYRRHEAYQYAHQALGIKNISRAISALAYSHVLGAVEIAALHEGKFDEAIRFANEQIAHVTSSISDEYELLFAVRTAMMSHIHSKDFAGAIVLGKKYLHLAERASSNEPLAAYYVFMAKAYFGMNQVGEARKYFLLAQHVEESCELFHPNVATMAEIKRGLKLTEHQQKQN